MQRLGQLVIGLVVAGIIFWIGWTSPSLKQCLQEAYYNNPQQPLQEYVTNLYGSFVGYRLCLGDVVHANGNGIIAIFTVILGIATWFLLARHSRSRTRGQDYWLPSPRHSQNRCRRRYRIQPTHSENVYFQRKTVGCSGSCSG